MDRILKNIKDILIPATLNSYSVIFFFNNRLFAIILLIATFFNITAGLSGLIATITTVVIADRMGFDKILIKNGVLSFNALIAGIGLGTLFEPGVVFFVFLLMSALISLMISVVLSGFLGKYGLPFLSIPFVITLWIIILPSGHFSNIGLTQRNVFWINEMYSVGGKPLLDLFQTIDNLPLNRLVTTYLRSLSSIIFQDNLLTGILISFAIFITSRITFLLTIIGFISAYLFAHFIGTDMASLSFYNIGANYMLFSIAAGGFFTIPSRYSYLWAIILVPVLSMLILSLRNLPGIDDLPLFSLPFSIMSITFLYFLGLRIKPGKLKVTFIQHYSPEINLYTYINESDRLTGFRFLPLHLPFWGEWTISQGYNGKYTHKGDWKNALDMNLTDENGKQYGSTPYTSENYYCYNKPVIAPADGTIADIIDNIEDNEPGKVNTIQNWGNSIILKHADNLYTQISHLKKGSFKKKKGDFVRNGEFLALCGNSGRSPEPHLHFQVQTTPLAGSRTLEYPFSYYLKKSDDKWQLRSYSIPSEGERIMNVSTDPLLRASFDFQPGMILTFSYVVNSAEKKTAKWEVFTDAFNNKYLFCRDTQSFAYFVNDGTMFYFTAFYGDHKSLLFHFYLAAYKILQGYYPDIEINDGFPLHIIKRNSLSLWLHDFAAPFHQYLKVNYKSRIKLSDSALKPSSMELETKINRSVFRKVYSEFTGNIILTNNRISEFSIETSKTRIWAQNTDI
jgi:urea transporter/murein DD-endopeptidase MepM/ murein hydrolase activator NlpD